jgi:hypothetical protein
MTKPEAASVRLDASMTKRPPLPKLGRELARQNKIPVD